MGRAQPRTRVRRVTRGLLWVFAIVAGGWGAREYLSAAPVPDARPGLGAGPTHSSPGPAEVDRPAPGARRVEGLAAAVAADDAPAAPPPASILPRAIAGLIVDAATDVPVGGARVIVTDKAGAHAFLVSDASGRFTFEAGPADTVSVDIRADSYAPLVRIGSVQRLRAAGVADEAGGHVRFRLERGRELVVVAVRRETGDPVEGCEIYLVHAPSGSGRSHVEHLGTTAAQGVLAPAPRVARYSEQATLIAIAADAAASICLETLLQSDSAAPLRVELEPLDRLRVAVSDAAGRHIERAIVEWRSSAHPWRDVTLSTAQMRDSGYRALLRARLMATDIDGIADIPSLISARDPAATTLVVRKAGYATRVLDAGLVGGGDAARIDVVLASQARIRSLDGSVSGPGGVAIGGASVRIAGRETHSEPGSGTFRFSNLDVDEVNALIEVEAAGFAPLRRFVRADAMSGTPVVTLSLQHAAVLAGVVLDGEGAPVSGALVRCHERDPEPGERVEFACARSDSAGRFAIADLEDGSDYTVQVSHPAGASAGFLGAGVSSLARPPRSDLRFVLERSRDANARIVAAVRDARTGEPLHVRTARLVAVPDGARQPALIPDDRRRIAHGEVRFDGVPFGRYDLWVMAADGGIAHSRVEPCPEAAHVRIDLHPGRSLTITGRVDWAQCSEEDGAAEIDLRATAVLRHSGAVPDMDPWRGSARPVTSAPVRIDGTFQLEGLLAGEYLVRVGGALRGVQHEGEAEVSLASGAGRSVSIPIVPVGSRAMLSLIGDQGAFDGSVWISLQEGARPVREFQLLPQEREGLRRDLLVPAGDVHVVAWRSNAPRGAERVRSRLTLVDEALRCSPGERRTIVVLSP